MTLFTMVFLTMNTLSGGGSTSETTENSEAIFLLQRKDLKPQTKLASGAVLGAVSHRSAVVLERSSRGTAGDHSGQLSFQSTHSLGRRGNWIWCTRSGGTASRCP